MGFLGLFIGPVLMALLVAIWREWMREVELTSEPTLELPAQHSPGNVGHVPNVARQKPQSD